MELSIIKKYLPYGKIKEYAYKNMVDYDRAVKLLNDKVKPKVTDESFINDCIDMAMAEKRRLDVSQKRLNIFL